MMKKVRRKDGEGKNMQGGRGSFKELKDKTEKGERMKQTPSRQSEVIQKMIISC